MAGFSGVVLGLLLACTVPFSSLAAAMPQAGAARSEAEMSAAMRAILARSRDPREVAAELDSRGARLLGLQRVSLSPGNEGLQQTRGLLRPSAGNKNDLTLTLWLYEWQNRDGTFTEQAVVSGNWSRREYRWLSAPADVIDVRWTAGDLVPTSTEPFDGVERDQQANGILSFTVDDQVGAWDLFVNFKPVSRDVQGRWTNLYVNYTHTWLGLKLSVTLGAAPNGGTGTITVTTDGKQWTEGTLVAFQIGSEGVQGPTSTARSVME